MGFKDKKKAEQEAAATSTDDQTSPRDADFSALDGAQGSEGSQSVESSQNSSVPDGVSAEVAKLKAEVEENKDKYLRALAEFENYKKRALKERSDLLKYQGEKVIYDLLEVLDNLEWALSHPTVDADKLKSGLELIQKLFVDVLARWEVRANSALGKEFDPVQHQAISKVAVTDSKPGTVLSELKKAYFYKDKLLRPGDVVVAVGKDGSTDPQQPANSDSQAAQDEGGTNS